MSILDTSFTRIPCNLVMSRFQARPPDPHWLNSVSPSSSLQWICPTFSYSLTHNWLVWEMVLTAGAESVNTTGIDRERMQFCVL